MALAQGEWGLGSGYAVAAALLLLGGAVGKSAQLPLQTWLPDAMAGPTPISALIHAATMVTAGVYLIARTHALFELAPDVQLLVALIGLATLLIAGFTAMTQHDIKRILAYSTISQIGYMFLGLGVGAWSASVFHLMTHAFFKALLFLAAGTVILSLHHEHDIFKMGGKWRQLPVAFASFLIGSLALAAFPYTSGYFSKDEILLAALELEHTGFWLWLGGVVGAFFTGIYSFRLVFVVFFGESAGHHEAREVTGFSMAAPLLVLMVLALAGGLIHVPTESVFAASEHGEHHVSALMHSIMIAVPLLGIALSYLFYGSRTLSVERLMSNTIAQGLHKFWFAGWGFDGLYRRLLITPYVWLAAVNKRDVVDTAAGLLVTLSEAGNSLLTRSQSGSLRWYILSVVGGTVLLITLGGVL
jgi:NADH-quinone oxidoreductase subunit L